MDKNDILQNLEYIEASDLFKYIIQGIVTLDEMMDTGNLSPEKRRKIKEYETANNAEDDNLWQQCGNDISKIREYLSRYPNGRHVESANERISAQEAAERQRLEYQRQMEASYADRKRELINRLKYNINKVESNEIYEALNNGTFTDGDIMEAGVPRNVVEFIHDSDTNKKPVLDFGEEPDAIPSGYTEVFFWGSPGSGKTCALAALLSTANKKGYLKIAEGPGYNYAVQLKNLFVSDVNRLPAPSPVDKTQYLPFALITNNKSRPVSMIELSGEIFECFLCKVANKPFPTTDHKATFDKITEFLSDNNRKIHFFFIDYARGNKCDVKGYTQSDYLEAASIYFQNTKIFKNNTDAIYLVVTKSDTMNVSGGNNQTIYNARVEECKRLLDSETDGYKSFKNVMKDICHREHINARRLMVEPFSLGDVFLSDICMFNPDSSMRILEILMDKIQPVDGSRLLNFLKQ